MMTDSGLSARPDVLDIQFASGEKKSYKSGDGGGYATLSVAQILELGGRGLHSSTFWLNFSAFCGTGGACQGRLGGG